MGVVSAVFLVALGGVYTVVIGLVFVALLFCLTVLLPSEDGFLAETAHRAAAKGDLLVGYTLAGVSAATVPAVVVIVNCLVLDYFREHTTSYSALWWLVSYGVATGAWTIRAHFAAPRNRTLSSIQAYAAHLGYALFSVGVVALGLSVEIGLLGTIIPQLLPFAVGFFLAIADRNTLRDVQI